MEKEKLISDLMSKMSISDKVGQCFVIGFCGTVITPEILHRIKKIKPAGIRVGLTFRAKTALHDPYATSKKFAHRVLREPTGTVKDILTTFQPFYCTNKEYGSFLNTMKKAALENELKIPIHITMDMEGDSSCDYPRGGISTFPFPMGQAASGDPKLAYDVAWATARQLTALGVNWLHSPVIDMNTEPMNPEIGARSYAETPDEVIKFVGEAIKGFKDGGMIATGKHFPGRGASTDDAHTGLPAVNLSKEEMEIHLKPFKAMVEAGLPSIMTAHTLYPALDPDNPATLSKKILTDILKDGWGFKGVITTDDITMGGIVERHEVHEACIMALNAGADLILLRDESPLPLEVIDKVIEAVKSGKISEKRINDAVRRTLSVKFDYGLFENGNLIDENKADLGISDPRVKEIAVDSAKRSLKLIRDKNKILPLSKKQNVLLVEQVPPLHIRTNDGKCHPGIFWEHLLNKSENVAQVEIEMAPTESDINRIMKRLPEADVIVTTNYFDRREDTGENFVDKLINSGKPVIVVTNSPYPATVSPEYDTVICTYGVSPESLKAASKLIFG